MVRKIKTRLCNFSVFLLLPFTPSSLHSQQFLLPLISFGLGTTYYRSLPYHLI